MMYLLDTNVVSELRKLRVDKCDPNVKRWLETVYHEQFMISVITHMEIRTGILKLEHRKDFVQADKYREWYEGEIVPTFADRTLPISLKIASLCAEFHIPNKRSYNDAFIAATAKAHHLTLVTRNTKDFQGLNLKLLNPFETLSH